MENKVIITGTIGGDVHIYGISLLSYALEDAGFKVIKLGGMVSQMEFIQAAIEVEADAILVSSLDGMAQVYCEQFKEKCIEAGLKDILLYIGGNLKVGKGEDWEAIEREFKEMGFDRVYPTSSIPEIVIANLKNDMTKS